MLSGLETNYRGMAASAGDFATHTMSPTTTGTSVLGLQFEDGVVLAADTLGSYGSLARFRNCSRVHKVNDKIVVAATGDYADFQYVRDILERKVIDEECLDDDISMKPRSLYCWLTRILYRRRSKFDPLWNTYVVAGIQDGVPFLGAVDKIGTAYEDKCIGTGYGSHIGLPMMRDKLDTVETLKKEAAIEVIEKCMEVLYYRDARSFYKYQMAIVTKDGVTIEDKVVNQNWQISEDIQGY